MKIHEENSKNPESPKTSYKHFDCKEPDYKTADKLRESSSYAALSHCYTYEDYRKTPPDTRVELIDGELIYMDFPSIRHQDILTELLYHIFKYIKKNKGLCKVYPSGLGVDLFADHTTIVSPDISVICDKSKLDAHECHGAPDWIIEIVSPGNPRHDYHKKLLLYRTAGVACYWIIDPQSDTVTVYSFPPAGSVDKELCEHFSFADTLPAPLHLTDLKINLNSLLT